MGLNAFLDHAAVEKQAEWHSLTPPGPRIDMMLTLSGVR